MALVDYSDSEEDVQETAPASKKRKLSTGKSDLPPLPSSFRDLYSSTVRASTRDDPALHGGRKRVTPHVEGNWPTHIYLEWYPNRVECKILSSAITAQQHHHDRAQAQESKQFKRDSEIHSLLQNDLGVNQPLHISLSRPLVLKTEQKTAFLECVQAAVSRSGVCQFNVTPEDLKWHSNEDGTRWFFVTRVAAANSDLLTLLDVCNAVARAFKQPLLYEEDEAEPSLWEQSHGSVRQHKIDKFHLSLAWSLKPPGKQENETSLMAESSSVMNLPAALRELNIPFTDVKIRIGQDVTSLRMDVERRKASGVLS